MKWVQRIHLLDRAAVERETSRAREQVFLEAIDCFCCMVPKQPVREKLIQIIAKGNGLYCFTCVIYFLLVFGNEY